jgi:TubC N-terminal docking domain
VSPTALLAELKARGVCLAPRGDRLHVVAPRGILTEEDKARLRAAKPALLELLARDRLAYSHPWPDVIPGLGGRRVVAFTACRDCAAAGGRTVTGRGQFNGQLVQIHHRHVPGTWVAYGRRPLCLDHARRGTPGGHEILPAFFEEPGR